MITISDIQGSRQYTLSQFIKVIAMWVALLIMIVLVAGGFFLHHLSNKVEEAQAKTTQAEEKTARIQQEANSAQLLINTLIKKQQKLEKKIQTKTESLSSLNKHLGEIEEILGLDSEPEMYDINRTNIVKREAIKKIEQKQLSLTLSNILNQSIPNGKPISYRAVSSKFGYRIHPITKKHTFHAGIDLSAKSGTPIYATADGVIEYAKRKGGYGNYILIDHPYGFKTAYGHLSQLNVKVGDYVLKNDLIGYVGNTGRSTGPHLHYEILYLHKWLNPAKFMRWNKQNYTAIMNQEPKVNWDAMLGYINRKLHH